MELCPTGIEDCHRLLICLVVCVFVGIISFVVVSQLTELIKAQLPDSSCVTFLYSVCSVCCPIYIKLS